MIVTNDLNTENTALRPWEESAPDCEQDDFTVHSAVDHPDHYNQGGVECIDALDACGFGLDFCVGNAIKYLWRFKEKQKPVEDLRKARWYIDHAISKIESGVYHA